ncbi:hypothetical protein VMUT_0998 [Vulcanisaeta moutnovskia 768-28]|uniref:Uncharacterized protein n=1 Tax=Vulcanisaeta moutnovskia (strain 768-28) TaxID=985053 RepID=F0QXG7_VULM7|nr:hypothetical protein [Vulcanisaeta moutnovskia]ADY01206.1 hypothetical protein VMUT_0998 [Vulcanisaeta moutnovskia 768-28]
MLGLLGYALLIEGLVAIIYGLVRGGLDVRRFVLAGTALVLAYFLPSILGIIPPGSPTYLMLYREVEGLVRDWSVVYYSVAYAGLAWASGMTVLNVIALLSTFGLVTVPLQYLTVVESVGWFIDPIADLILAVMHIAQVMTAVLHTIAYLAWFSYAVAPMIIAVAVPLMVMGRTRASGVALFVLTLTILFITTIAARDAMVAARLQLMNETVAFMSWLTHNAPNATVRGFLVLSSPYPYLASGLLYGVNYTVVGKSTMPTEYPVTQFTAFTQSVTLINALGVPRISNVTFLWLGIDPTYNCLLLTYIGNESAYEPCDSWHYLNSNSTYAEVIDFGGPPFNVVTATINGSAVYTGAWEWLDTPNQYSVNYSNNTVTINFTIDVPPMHCINVTSPKTHMVHKVCQPGTAEAMLWFFAGNAMINVPTNVGNSTRCQYAVSPSSLYREVSIEVEENAIKALIDKLNEEIAIGRGITGLGRSLSLSLPNPYPWGYAQKEAAITCTNWLNRTVPVSGSIVIIGNINNPWFAYAPIGLSPSTSWVINSIVVGSGGLLSGWAQINGLLMDIGYFVPRWLAESVAIFGLLDAGLWLVGFPTMLGPAWAVLGNVVMDLSLILYLQVAGVRRVLGRLIRRARSSVGSRLRGFREGVASGIHRHGRLGKIAKPLMALHHSYSRASALVRMAFRSRLNNPAIARLSRYAAHPYSSLLEDLEARFRSGAAVHRESGRRGLARMAMAGAYTAWFLREYPRVRGMGERGRLHEVAGLRFRGGVELDRRAYAHYGGNPRTDLPTHLLTKSLVRRVGVEDAVHGVEAVLNTPLALISGAAASDSVRALARQLIGRFGVERTSRASAKIVAASMAPYVRELHRRALVSMRRLGEAKEVIKALVGGELHRLVELSQLMGVDYEKAKELLNNALSARVNALMPRYLGDGRVRDSARVGIKHITDVLHDLRGSVVLSHEALRPLINAFMDNARAVEVINNWWVKHSERVGKAISSGVSNEDLMLINRLSVRELTKALEPFVRARYREALEARARELATKEALPTAVGEFLRAVRYGDWARERLRGVREYRAFMREYGRLLRGGFEALGEGRLFSEVFPRIAEIARDDLLVDSAIKLHLATTAREGVVERLSGGSRSSLINLIDYSDSIRRQPMVALLELLNSLGVDLNKAIDWQSYSELYGRLGIKPSELRALLRALRALVEDGVVNEGEVERRARDLLVKASSAKPDVDVFREFHRDLWRAVLRSARDARPGDFIGVRSIDDDRLRELLVRYMPPELTIELLSQIRGYTVEEVGAVLSNLRSYLASLIEELRDELRGLEARLGDAIGNGRVGETDGLGREVGGLRRRLMLHERLLSAVNNALGALTSSEPIDIRTQLLRRSARSIREALDGLGGGFEGLVDGYRASNLLDALAVVDSIIEGLRSYVGKPSQPN